MSTAAGPPKSVEKSATSGTVEAAGIHN